MPEGRSLEEIRAELEEARLDGPAARYAELRAELDAYHTRRIEGLCTTDPELRAQRVAEGRAIAAALVDAFVEEWQAERAKLK